MASHETDKPAPGVGNAQGNIDHGTGLPLIESGWLLIGRFEQHEQVLIEQVRDNVLKTLTGLFPDFRWEMPVVTRPVHGDVPRPESVEWLLIGQMERHRRHWDYVFVVTRQRPTSYFHSQAMAMVSKVLSCALLSLEPFIGEDEFPGARVHDLTALTLHLFGDLHGLPHGTDSTEFMYPPSTRDDLQQMDHFRSENRALLGRELNDTADARLEERTRGRDVWKVGFYSRTLYQVGDDVIRATLQAKPWEFPLRLAGLSTAAVSTLLILIMTAEVWELGMRQSISKVASLSLLIWIIASGVILVRHDLWLALDRRHLTEQIAVTNLAMTMIVMVGMGTTYVLLLLLGLGLGYILFDATLITSWAGSGADPGRFAQRLSLAGLLACLGITIGALGASFQGRHHFRHVVYVDEEI